MSFIQPSSGDILQVPFLPRAAGRTQRDSKLVCCHIGSFTAYGEKGHVTMESFPEALLAQVPRLGAMEGQTDPMVWALLVNPVSGWQWYIIELEPLATDTICRVYEVGWDAQLTYFNLSDLELHAAQVGAPNAFDTNFVPCRLSEVRAQEGSGSAKFPLGQ